MTDARRPRLAGSPSPRPPLAHPRRAVREPARDRDRQHDRQRGAAHPRARPRHEHQRPPVGGRRVHARVRRAAPHRRQRSATGSGARARSRSAWSIFGGASAAAAFAGGVDAAHRRSRGHGRRRRADHAGDAVDPHQRVHRRARACARHRALVGRRRHRGRARSGHRRLPARPLLVGLGVHRERADRHRRGRSPGRFLVPTSRNPERPRLDLVGRRLVDRRPRRARCRHHRGAQQRLDRPADPRRLRGRGGRAQRLRAVGAPHRRADARRPLLRQPALHRRQRHRHARVLRPLRVHLPRHAVPAVRARLLARSTPASARCRSRSR